MAHPFLFLSPPSPCPAPLCMHIGTSCRASGTLRIPGREKNRAAGEESKYRSGADPCQAVPVRSCSRKNRAGWLIFDPLQLLFAAKLWGINPRVGRNGGFPFQRERMGAEGIQHPAEQSLGCVRKRRGGQALSPFCWSSLKKWALAQRRVEPWPWAALTLHR